MKSSQANDGINYWVNTCRTLTSWLSVAFDTRQLDCVQIEGEIERRQVNRFGESSRSCLMFWWRKHEGELLSLSYQPCLVLSGFSTENFVLYWIDDFTSVSRKLHTSPVGSTNFSGVMWSSIMQQIHYPQVLLKSQLNFSTIFNTSTHRHPTHVEVQGKVLLVNNQPEACKREKETSLHLQLFPTTEGEF
jgi:hypothetical protein